MKKLARNIQRLIVLYKVVNLNYKKKIFYVQIIASELMVAVQSLTSKAFLLITRAIFKRFHAKKNI